ncbi:SDH family Clp fold serine proteinase [Bradyrhizobium sp. USDA 4473]
MADDILVYLHERLEAGKAKAKKGIDLFIHSNGGSGTVPWRIVNLIREYTKDFSVLVPHHAFSAATLTALGADRVIMHRMGCLGPIDPSVTNYFNPPNPHNPSQLIPISVEDVSAYITLIKDDIGIRHEDELVEAVKALTDKIHPLALGNVQRSHNQSRMIATKLLRKHVPVESEHEIEQLIENLKSNLFFHGHPINREEARVDLKIKAENAPPKLEDLMWSLFLEYSNELKLTVPLNPNHEWEVGQPPTMPGAPQPLTTSEIMQQLQQLAQSGVGIGTPGLTTQQIVDIAAAMVPHISVLPPTKKVRVSNLKGAYLEAIDKANVFFNRFDV